MTIQTSIVEALKASQTAHHAGLAEVKALRTEKAALQDRVTALDARVAELQAETHKLVDPDTVQPLLDELARAVAATHAAVTPPVPAPAVEAEEKPAPEATSDAASQPEHHELAPAAQ